MRRGNEDVLNRLVERAVSALAQSTEAQDLLRANGVTDESVWRAYRLGALNKAVVAALDAADKKRLIELGMHRAPRTSPLTSGVAFPTCDPREPNQPIGLVKVSPAQNKHDFVGAAQGVACTADIADQNKIIVTNNPFLMLSLAQAGVAGAVLAEVPEVLPPLLPWLKEREVVLVSVKNAGLDKLKAALGDFAGRATALLVSSDLGRMSAKTAAALGLNGNAAPKESPAPVAKRIPPAAVAIPAKVVSLPANPPPKHAPSHLAKPVLPAAVAIPAKLVPLPVVPPKKIDPAPTAQPSAPLNCTGPATETPVLVANDTKTMMATFKAGTATYMVECAPDVGSRLQIRIEKDGKVALDRFDFSIEQQRRRFATNAAIRTGMSFERIEADLLFLLEEAQRIQTAQAGAPGGATPAASLPTVEREAALAALSKPDLLDAIAADFERLGWPGDEGSKKLLWLVAVSRKLPGPLSASIQASTGGAQHVLDLLSSITPPEERLHVSRLSDSALYYADANALRHKALILDNADQLSAEVLTALRVLQTRGALSQTVATRDPVTGQSVTSFIEAKGPVSILLGSGGKQDRPALARSFELSLDDSPDQTARLLEAQRRMHAAPNDARQEVVQRLQNLQRMLKPLAVVIPFSERIEFPASSPRYWKEQDRFLTLIEASALVHQHQRQKVKGTNGEEYVLATERDFEIAVALAAGFISRSGDELSGNARDVLALIEQAGVKTFSLSDLKALRPHWTRHKFYSGLEELVGIEALVSTKGRGKVREYELVAGGAGAHAHATVRLKPDGELSKLLNPGDNNFTPVAATG